MARLLATRVRRGPDDVALTTARSALTWSELDDRVNRWVDVLRRHGLGVGDRLLFVTGNRPVTFEALLACLHSGVIAVPVSWRLTAAELSYLISDSSAAGVVTEPNYAARVVDALGRTGAPVSAGFVAGDVGVSGLRPVEALLADADPGEPDGQCSGSVMLYTSATTGQPNGVLTSLFSPGADLERLRRTVAGLGETFDLPSVGRVLLAGPWYHAAQVFFSLFPLLRGCDLVLRQQFDAAATLDDLRRERISMCHLVPTQFIRLLGLDEPTRAGFDSSHLRRVWHGGAACPPDVKQQMIDWWGPVLTEYYAATEAGIVTTIDSAEWLARRGSVGRPVPGTEVMVVDDDGAVLPAGGVGTVYVRRTPARGFSYHNAPGKTAAAFRQPGTFTVGDLGRLDDDGYLYLTGRRADTIISGGVNIYPAEVEAALASHPAVRDVAVIGIPDSEYGERVLAVVEPWPDSACHRVDLPELLDAHCRDRLAAFKRPRAYEVVDELPREPTGKLRRVMLRQPYWGS